MEVICELFCVRCSKKDLNDRSSVNRKNWHTVGISAKKDEDDAVKSSVKSTIYIREMCIYISLQLSEKRIYY